MRRVPIPELELLVPGQLFLLGRKVVLVEDQYISCVSRRGGGASVVLAHGIDEQISEMLG